MRNSSQVILNFPGEPVVNVGEIRNSDFAVVACRSLLRPRIKAVNLLCELSNILFCRLDASNETGQRVEIRPHCVHACEFGFQQRCPRAAVWVEQNIARSPVATNQASGNLRDHHGRVGVHAMSQPLGVSFAKIPALVRFCFFQPCLRSRSRPSSLRCGFSGGQGCHGCPL